MWQYLIDTRNRGGVPGIAKVWVTKRTAARATIDSAKTKRARPGYIYTSDKVDIRAGSGYKLFDTLTEAREVVSGVIERRAENLREQIRELEQAQAVVDADTFSWDKSLAEMWAERELREAQESATQIALTAQLEGKGITNNDHESDGA